LNKIRVANLKITDKLKSIKELYDVKKITIDVLQALFDLLNSNHIVAQEESKETIKRMVHEFNIKRYYLRKDLELKQCCIESSEIRTIKLN